MDRFLVKKLVARTKDLNSLRAKTQKIQKKRDLWSAKHLKLSERVRNEVMPDDERAALQREMLALSAALDKTSYYAASRFHERCSVTGWGRGLKIGIRRNEFRRYASFGQIAGLIKV